MKFGGNYIIFNQNNFMGAFKLFLLCFGYFYYSFFIMGYFLYHQFWITIGYFLSIKIFEKSSLKIKLMRHVKNSTYKNVLFFILYYLKKITNQWVNTTSLKNYLQKLFLLEIVMSEKLVSCVNSPIKISQLTEFQQLVISSNFNEN